MSNTLRIGLVGYKFMGKAHSHAYHAVPRFFEPPLVPELKVLCGRDAAGVSAAAQKYGWQHHETSWQALVGDIESVSATAETFVKERPLPAASTGLAATGARERGQVTVDDAVIAMARFSNGALGTFEATRFALGHKNGGAFEINGSKGSLRFNLERMNELEYLDASGGSEQGFRTILATDGSHPYMSAWWPPGHMLGWEHSHVHQIYDLLDAIGHNRMPEPSLIDGAKNQAVLEALGQSITDATWHAVERVT